MTLPQVKAQLGEDRPTKSLPSDTGTALLVGLADHGPVGVPTLIRSLAQYVDTFGPRVAYGSLYDTLDVAFHEGLDHAYVQRCVGPAAVVASKNLANSSSETTLKAVATSAGAWANSIEVAIVEGVTEGTFHIHISYSGTLKESSPELADNTAAVAWAANSDYIRLEDDAKGDPKVQSVTLASGADDRENVDATVFEEALSNFGADLGAAQVAIPGNYAEAVQEAIIAHCAANLRIPVLDSEDTEEAEPLIANAGTLRSTDGAKQGAIFAPWDIAPGISLGTTRTVPPCARQLGAMARVDAESGTPDTAAAGPEQGKARYCIGLSQKFSEADQEALNDAGVNVSILDEGTPTTFGWRSLADPVNDRGYLPFSTARLATSLAYGAKAVLRRYLFKKLDDQGTTRTNAQTDIQNEVLKPAYEAKALFGATEAEAAGVEVTQAVNPTNGSIGSLSAVLAFVPTEFAEVIELTVTETNEAL